MMAAKLFYLLLIISAVATNCRGNQADEDDVPLVRVRQGLVKGIKENAKNGREFYSYMSIPFAEPPVGKLRFKDPVPLKSWEGVVDGSKMPVYCMQAPLFEPMLEDSATTTLLGKEDCLQLNVFTKAPNESDKKLPVMVFIHGGGFVIGGTQEYPPHVLMNKDIVLVTIQYRVGIFGFLSTEDSVMPGNMGLKDQQLALKWVKENIASFGGDPDTITIFGESAGGASVHYQVLSPGSKGLFKRAILQSGSALCPWASAEKHKVFAVEAGRQFNCSLNQGTETYLECMQEVNPLFLLLVASSTAKIGLEPRFDVPRVDGEFISDAPEILMKEGKFNKVDLMAGVTRDEGAFSMFMMHLNPSLMKKINDYFSEYGVYSLGLQDEENSAMLARKIYQQYLETEGTTIKDSDRKKIVKLHSDNYFVEPHDTTVHLLNNAKVDLFTYQLNHFGQSSFLDLLPTFDRTDLVSHADDLAYLFEGKPYFPKPMENEEDLKLREIFLSMWTNFAKTGNPNSDELDFTWDKTTEKSFRHLSLTPNPRMEEDNFSKKRKFWSSLKTKRNFNLQQTENKDEL